jgi:predicted porin
MIAAADGSATTGLPVGNAHKSVRLGYAAGPVNVAFSTGTTSNGTSGASFKHSNFAGMYNLGVAKVMGQWNKVSSNNGKSQKAMLLGVSVPMGTNEIRASYVTADGSGTLAADNKDAKQFNIGYVHNLSKRTALYGTYSKISNSGVGTYSLGPVAAAAGGGATGYEVGVRHSF